MVNNKSIFEQFGGELVKEIQGRLPKATGNTANAIEFEATDTTLDIYGPDYIGALEYGRSPTVNKGPGDLLKNIIIWLNAKGIQAHPGANGLTPSPKSLAYMIARKIHKQGTDLYEQYKSSGKGSGVLSDVITDDRITAFFDVFATNYLPTAFDTIVDEVKAALDAS